jgi:hypothetical protein
MTFYRIAKTNPPTEKDYVTPFERRGAPPTDASDEVRESWYAFSAFDSIEGARNQALQVRGIGKFIFRYEIPEGIGITWKQTLGPGHYDLWGDKEILKSCEVGYVCDV